MSSPSAFMQAANAFLQLTTPSCKQSNVSTRAVNAFMQAVNAFMQAANVFLSVKPVVQPFVDRSRSPERLGMRKNYANRRFGPVHRSSPVQSSPVQSSPAIVYRQFNLTSNDIKVENMSKSNCMQKIVYPTRYEIHVKHDFHRFFIFFFSRIASVRYTEIYFKNRKFLRGHIPSFNQRRLHFR